MQTVMEWNGVDEKELELGPQNSSELQTDPARNAKNTDLELNRTK